MNIKFVAIIFLLAYLPLHAQSRDTNSFFSNLRALRFEEAKTAAASVTDSSLREEMINLADLLFYAGQKDKSFFRQSTKDIKETNNRTLDVVRWLYAGYYSLFYDQLKGDAYRCFHQANRIAAESGDVELKKACAYAFLKYYGFEIAQNGSSYQTYLQTLSKLPHDSVDELWITLYEMMFLSKELSGLDTIPYFKKAKDLDLAEVNIDKSSPLLAYLYYEKALALYARKNQIKATEYYQKAIDHSGEFPYFNTERFLAHIQLLRIAVSEKRFKDAKEYYKLASLHRNLSDTLRSDYYLNLYGSVLLNAENGGDSAYQLLMKAYLQEFELDFRRNTLEINKLKIELETQEKENEFLKLREKQIWLITALLVTALISIAIYFAYAYQRSRNRIQTRNNQSKIEKLLKEQELIGINSMLEGQEKERQSIATELHDDLGSVLTTLKFHFQSFHAGESSDPNKKPSLEHSSKLLDEAYQKVRAIAHLRNAGVDPNEGLLRGVRSFASKVSKFNNLSIEINDHGMDRRLDNNLEITVFRIVQELIANVIKHAKATSTTINLTQHEQSLNIMVEDNGIGFDAAHIKTSAGMGIYSIQKRVESLGGNVTIESIAKSGTTVIIDIPIL